jgi:cytoskeletal protein RodZ
MKWLKSKDDTKQSTASVEQQRAEKLAELGGQLWATRQERGLSLDEMVMLTRIPRRLLQAIEEGNLNELPEPIYIQGLIRQFADALGFNGVNFASTFPLGSNRVSLKPKWKITPMGQLRPVHLYVLYIVMIVFSVSSLSQLLSTATTQASSSHSREKSKVEPVSNSNQIQKIQLEEVKSVSDNIVSTSNTKDLSVQIGVTVKEKSWIRVVADGKTVFEDDLPEGTQRIWKAEKQLTVRAGNAGGVMVSVNKEQAKPMGDPGKVEEVIVAAKPRT